MWLSTKLMKKIQFSLDTSLLMIIYIYDLVAKDSLV